MEKARRYVTVLWCGLLLGAAGLHAANTIEADSRRHRLSLTGKGGLGTMLYSLDNARYKAGAGGSVGVEYDFYFLPYMGVGSGLEFSFLRASYRVGERNYAMAAQDNDPMFGEAGEPFTFLVAMRNEQTEQSATYLNIPLMLRFRVKWFSFGAGVKAGFALAGKYDRFTGELKTSGQYARFPEPLEDMPAHGFVNGRAVYGSGKLTLRTDWAVSVDFGITLRPEGKGKGEGGRVPFLEAGVFADYGLRNIHKGGADAVYPITYDASVSGMLRHHSGLVSASGKPSPLHSLAVGLRIAVGLSWR